MRDLDVHRSAKVGAWLLIGLLALFAGGKAILFDSLDPDCFWHMRVAGQLQRDGVGPVVDDLSFASMATPWTPYSWLAELGMRGLWHAGGYRAAVAFTACMQAAIILLLGACCVEVQSGERRYLPAVMATAVGAFLILPYLSFRPVTAGFVLLFLIAWLLLRDLKAEKRYPLMLWCVVPLTVVLTNVHLFSFFVPAMVLAMAVGAMVQRDQPGAVRYGILATATALACLATPMLPGLIRTIFFYTAQDKMVTGPVIAEMQTFAHGTMGWVMGAGLAAMLLCIGLRHRMVPVALLICVGATAVLMLKLGRFAPLFALAACPALAATMPGLKDRILSRRPVVFALAVVLLMGIIRVMMAFPQPSMSLSAWVNRHGPDTPGYPCAAADYLEHSVPHPTGHLINEFSWGGYLAWRLDGTYKVLLDGRTQVYPQSLWQGTYLGTEIDRERFLSRVQADAALLPANRSTFKSALTHLGWTSIYKDDRAEILLPPSGIARIE
jgi:hypothetical protein